MSDKAILFYKEQKAWFLKKQTSLKHKKSILFRLRIVSFLFAIMLPIAIFSDVTYIVSGIFVGLAILLYIIRKDYLLDLELASSNAAIDALAAEINIIEKNIFPCYNGVRFYDTKHPYSADLDIFGEHSVYHYINRTFTSSGEKTLADWLKYPSDINQIEKRQNAIEELSSKPQLLLEIRILSEKYKMHKVHNDFCRVDTSVICRKLLIIIYFCFFLTTISVVSFFLLIMGLLNYLFLILIVFINYFLIYGFFGKFLKKAFSQVTNISDQLQFYEEFVIFP